MRQEVSKFCCTTGKLRLIDLLGAGLPTDLQFVRNALSSKHSKASAVK